MQHKSLRLGVSSTISAHIIWGVLPFYWKALSIFNPFDVLTWRISGCLILTWLMIAFRKRPFPVKLLSGKNILLIVFGSVMICANWGVFLLAISTDQLLEASIGYYFNPLVNVMLGMIFFSEKLSWRRFLALVLAAVAVTFMSIPVGHLPWISVILALSFAIYGLLIKKLASGFDNVEILAMVMTIPGISAVIYLSTLAAKGQWVFFDHGITTIILLFLAGLITFFPLWLFGIGARRLPLGLVGFIQYIGPTFMLIIATFIFQEPVGFYRGTAIALIITALILYSSTFKNVGHKNSS